MEDPDEEHTVIRDTDVLSSAQGRRPRAGPVADAVGVRVRIVDKTAEPGTTCARCRQARTLEFYGQVGLADAVVELDGRRRRESCGG